MKKSIRWVSRLLGFYLVFFALPVFAQIQVQLKYPSVFQFIPTDLWNVTITNYSTDTKTVYLTGIVKDNSQNVLVKVTSSSFSVTQGSHVYSSANISTASIDYFNTDIQHILTTAGQFPAASYVSCVQVFDNTNNTSLDQNCVENTVEVISPPHLVYPTDGEVIDNAFPVFSWSPASPLRPGQQVDYQIKIVELYDNQSPEDGIARNEAFYSNDEGNALLQSYGFENIPFDEDKNYAWQVTASIGDYIIGGSEVWKFSYKPAPIDSTTFGLDDDYILLRVKTDGGYYMANGCIKFRFTDEYHTGIKSIKLMGSSSNDITPRNLVLKQPFKDDRYVIDLTNIPDIEHQNFYLLQVNTNSGQTFTIRFKYLDPTAGL